MKQITTAHCAVSFFFSICRDSTNYKPLCCDFV